MEVTGSLVSQKVFLGFLDSHPPLPSVEALHVHNSTWILGTLAHSVVMQMIIASLLFQYYQYLEIEVGKIAVSRTDVIPAFLGLMV